MVFSSVLSTKPKYNANAHYIMVCSFERPWSKLALAWSHPFQITERTSVERLFELCDKMSSSLSLLDTRIKLTWMQRLFLSWKFSSHIAFLFCAVDSFLLFLFVSPVCKCSSTLDDVPFHLISRFSHFQSHYN